MRPWVSHVAQPKAIVPPHAPARGHGAPRVEVTRRRDAVAPSCRARVASASLGFAYSLNPRLLCCHTLPRVAIAPAFTCGSRWKQSSLWLRRSRNHSSWEPIKYWHSLLGVVLAHAAARGHGVPRGGSRPGCRSWVVRKCLRIWNYSKKVCKFAALAASQKPGRVQRWATDIFFYREAFIRLSFLAC